MSSVLRLALTCLLALTLPIQGYAASSMLLCGPNHQGHQSPAAPSQAQVHEQHAPGSAHHGHAAAGQQTQSAVDDATAQPGDAADPASTGKPVHQSSGKCSVCAACCNAAAIAPTTVMPDLAVATPAYLSARLEPHAGFTPGGLERPPRLTLA